MSFFSFECTSFPSVPDERVVRDPRPETRVIKVRKKKKKIFLYIPILESGLWDTSNDILRERGTPIFSREYGWHTKPIQTRIKRDTSKFLPYRGRL